MFVGTACVYYRKPGTLRQAGALGLLVRRRIGKGAFASIYEVCECCPPN